MQIHELDTPALLIDRETVLRNNADMQSYADAAGVALRPHTKTHKMPYFARLQEEQGARGITVAKTGEAEVMAAHGLRDIFIANEIVGAEKLRRIRALAESGVRISFGVDSPCQVMAAQEIFADAKAPVPVLIEIEVGENRSGIIEEADYFELLDAISACDRVALAGVFSHDGHSYSVPDTDACREASLTAQRRTLHFAALARERGFACETVSIGSTPSQMLHVDILPGVTEMRPGTFIFMDASMANVTGDRSICAATVLATVISRPTAERVILDVGAKGITMQARTSGICQTKGLGTIKGYEDVTIYDVYDEHAIIYNKAFRDAVAIGDKVEIIPVHICPVVNLHEHAYLVSGSEVVEKIPVLCRGKLQ